VDIIDRLNALRGTAHEVGLAAIEEIMRLRAALDDALAAKETWAMNGLSERLLRHARSEERLDEYSSYTDHGHDCIEASVKLEDADRLDTQVRELAEIVEGQVAVIARLQRQVDGLREERSPIIYKVTATHKGDTDDRP
jgi:hypothetical protein